MKPDHEKLIGQIAHESTRRAGSEFVHLPVCGVDSKLGITRQTRYQSDDLTRYKVLEPRMFAYNPMRLNIGSIGFLPSTSDPVLVSPDYVVFGCNDAVVPEYLNYYTQSTKWADWVAAAGTGSVRSRIYFKELARMPLQLLQKRDQMNVVEVLNSFDALEEALHKEDSLIMQLCMTLFDCWFLRFEPVRLNWEGPGDLGTHTEANLSLSINFVDRSQSQLPDGWRMGTLADLAALNAKSWSAKDAPEWVRYIDLGAVKANRIDTIPEYRFADAPSRARRVVKAGDTIIGTVRPGNRSFAYIGQARPGLTASTGFAVLSPIEPWHREFVYLAATRDGNVDRLAKLAEGAAYPAVRPEVVLQTEVAIPPDDVLREFSNCLRPLFARLVKNRESSKILGELRSTLLPRLLSGKVCLAESHALLQEAIA